MWKVPSQVSGFNGQLKYVDSCPNEPVPAKAFCYQHREEAEKQGIPTNLHEYKPAQGRHIIIIRNNSNTTAIIYIKLSVKKTVTSTSPSSNITCCPDFLPAKYWQLQSQDHHLKLSCSCFQLVNHIEHFDV